MMLRSLLSATVVGALVIPVGSQAQAAPGEAGASGSAPNVVPAARPGKSEPTYNGKVIVKFKPGAPSGDAGQAASVDRVGKAKGKKLKVKRKMGSGAALVEGATAAEAVELASAFDQLPEVEYAEPDRLMTHGGLTNDTYANSQWDLAASPGINAASAWTRSTGKGVVVAVVDTGVLAHPDLAANTLPGYDFISDPTVGNDGDGRDGDATDPGDATASSGRSSTWHGTHVAGTIAAVANNGVGIAGIAYDAKILPVRALGVGGGWMSDVSDGIIWASGAPVYGVPTNSTPAQVVNLSLGGPGVCSMTEQNAINTARSRGTVVVTAAGNENSDASTSSPGNCAGVVDVAAVDSGGNRALYSNYGTGVTLAAPGSSILSTWNNGTTSPGSMAYGTMNGTSMAAPHVAGVAALLKSVSPTMTPDDVKAALVGATNPPTGSCSGCGAGLLDAGKALAAQVPTTPTPTPSPAPTPTVSSLMPSSGGLAGGTTVTVTGTNLDAVSLVLVGGVSATIGARTDTSLAVTVPARSSAAAVPVVLRYASSNVSAGTYTYVAGPVLSALAPASGSPAGGTTVTLTGSGFSGATEVSFGGRAAQFTVSSATSIVATAPALPAGGTTTPYVTVTTPYGTSAPTSIRYTYAAPTPAVLGLSARSGNPDGGNAVTVTGRAFTGVQRVTVGGAEVGFVVNSDTSITIPRMPAIANGVKSVYVIVSNPWKSSTQTSYGMYTYVVPVPAVSAMSPAAGSPLGGVVTLSGTNFAEVNKVTVGGVEVAFDKSVDTTKLTLTVPALAAGVATGSVSVVPHNKWIAGRGATYTYRIPTPYVSGLSVRSGNPDGGNAVTVTGQALTEVTKVTVGGVEVEHVVNSATSITIPRMPAIANGVANVYVVVSNPWKSSAMSYTGRYTYVVPVPTVTAMTPAIGSPLGATVTLTGTSFAEVDKVTVGGAEVAFGKSGDNTKLTLTVPALPDGVTTGSVPVVPHNKWIAGRGRTYTYAINTPVVRLSQYSGQPVGGDRVKLTGYYLADVTEVWFGASKLDSFDRNADASLTVTVPRYVVGGPTAVPIVAKTPWHSSAAVSYRYLVSVPSVTSVSPATGSTAGGQTVLIGGSRLADGTSVKFGDVAATEVTVVSASQLRVVVPAAAEGVVGKVPITVGNDFASNVPSTYAAYTYVAPPSSP